MNAFRDAKDRAGRPPGNGRWERCVGSHEDVAGARGAGIPVVWLSENKGEFPPDVAAPDYTIRNLTELPALLGLE